MGAIVGTIATNHMIKSESTRFYMNQLWGTEDDFNLRHHDTSGDEGIIRTEPYE